MSYVVEQKIKGRIYLYEVENFWDKEKKQPRQKRKYIGPKEKIYNKSKAIKESKLKPSNFASKSYGDIFLTSYLQDELGLRKLLKDTFKEDYETICALSSFAVQENSASYLFPYWHDEHYIDGVSRLNSQQLSLLYERLGRCERDRLNFLKGWSKHLSPTLGIYYDITSISSYSTQIDSVEWGYNRDREHLPQINMGFTHCIKTSLPLSYTMHPGSIVDVTTLKNTIKTLKLFELSDLFFILDRGFCSVSNLLEMHKNKMNFIQPLSFRLKQAKELVLKHKGSIGSLENILRYKEEILYHTSDKIEFEGITFDAHIFYNEKMAVDYKHYLYKGILEIESEIQKLTTQEEHKNFLENTLPGRFKKYFKQTDNGLLVRNQSEIDEAIYRSGVIIFVVSHTKHMDNVKIIEHYRNRDKVEKEIGSIKNYIDTHRIRAHHQDTANGRLFVKFLSLILHTKIVTVVKNHPKLKNYSVNEIIAELRKLKVNSFDKSSKFLTELSKKQKMIFKAFNIDTAKLEQHLR